MLRCSICSFQATSVSQLRCHIERHEPRACKIGDKYVIDEACPMVLLVAALSLIKKDLLQCKGTDKYSLIVIGLDERGAITCLQTPYQYYRSPLVTVASQVQLNLLHQLLEKPIKTVDYAQLSIIEAPPINQLPIEACIPLGLPKSSEYHITNISAVMKHSDDPVDLEKLGRRMKLSGKHRLVYKDTFGTTNKITIIIFPKSYYIQGLKNTEDIAKICVSVNNVLQEHGLVPIGVQPRIRTVSGYFRCDILNLDRICKVLPSKRCRCGIVCKINGLSLIVSRKGSVIVTGIRDIESAVGQMTMARATLLGLVSVNLAGT
jgi:hypothetical protein